MAGKGKGVINTVGILKTKKITQNCKNRVKGEHIKNIFKGIKLY